jgi:hypothetical protein
LDIKINKLRLYLSFIIALIVTVTAIINIINYKSLNHITLITSTLILLLQIISAVDYYKEKNSRGLIFSTIGSLSCIIIIFTYLIH